MNRWRCNRKILAAAALAAAASLRFANGQGFPEPEATAAPAGPDAKYAQALKDTVTLAQDRVANKSPGDESRAIVATLQAIAPHLREEQKKEVDDWIPLVYARYGETDQALAAVKAGKEAAAVRLLLVSFEANMAKKDPEAAKDAANRILALLNASMGTLSAPGMFEAGIKVASRLGDVRVVSAIGSVAGKIGPEEAASLRITAVRNFVADKKFAEAEQVSGQLGNPLARYDALALIAQARESAGEKEAAAANYSAALRALKSNRSEGVPAFPPMMAAVGLYRCGVRPSDTNEADLFVLNLEPVQAPEMKIRMLDAAGAPFARLRVAAAFKDVLMVGEEALKLGKTQEAGKTIEAWLAGEKSITRVSEVLGLAAGDDPPGPNAIPGRVDRLIRAGRALGETGNKTKAADALNRAAEALDLIVIHQLRPDWLASVAVAQANAGLKEQYAATIAKSLEWCGVVSDEAKRIEMRARVALAQVSAGDLEGARKTAELLKASKPGQTEALKKVLAVGEVWPAIGIAEIRAGRKAQGEAAFKSGIDSAPDELKPVVAASIATARVDLGDIAGATAIVKQFPGAPLPAETRTLMIAMLTRSGKIEDARAILAAGVPEHSPALAERIKLAAVKLKELRQHKAAVEVLALLPGETPAETMASIFTAAAEAGEGAFLAQHVHGEELAMGERLAAVTLGRKGDAANARLILKALVDMHISEKTNEQTHAVELVARGDPGTMYPAMVADGVALAAIGEYEQAARLGRAAFNKINKLWVQNGWKEEWLRTTMAASVSLRVAARDYDALVADITAIDQSIRADLAGLLAQELLNGTGPLAALR